MSTSETAPMGAYRSLPFPCCEHCGCGTRTGWWPEREGHDDTCANGCNDDVLSALCADPACEGHGRG